MRKLFLLLIFYAHHVHEWVEVKFPQWVIVKGPVSSFGDVIVSMQ